MKHLASVPPVLADEGFAVWATVVTVVVLAAGLWFLWNKYGRRDR